MKNINALLVTKGHPFERESFFNMIDQLQYPDQFTEITWTHVEHPAAEALLTPEGAAPFDAIVFYDMPGVLFKRDIPPFEHVDPSEKFKENFLALLESGKGMVFLHHAIASWPTWPEFAEIIGGRFHFLPGKLEDKDYPGSGYRFHVKQEITVEDPTHPIVSGIAPTFSIQDEAYLYPVLEHKVKPLLRSNFEFTADRFRMGGVAFHNHPKGSDLVGWTKHYANSPIAYLQMGHGPHAYLDPNYRKLIANAVKWASSADALLESQNAV